MPVALRSTLGVSERQAKAARGWLFVVNGERRLHFCPICARRIQQVCADDIKE
jgi:hypothetical protein